MKLFENINKPAQLFEEFNKSIFNKVDISSIKEDIAKYSMVEKWTDEKEIALQKCVQESLEDIQSVDDIDKIANFISEGCTQVKKRFKDAVVDELDKKKLADKEETKDEPKDEPKDINESKKYTIVFGLDQKEELFENLKNITKTSNPFKIISTLTEAEVDLIKDNAISIEEAEAHIKELGADQVELVLSFETEEEFKDTLNTLNIEIADTDNITEETINVYSGPDGQEITILGSIEEIEEIISDLNIDLSDIEDTEHEANELDESVLMIEKLTRKWVVRAGKKIKKKFTDKKTKKIVGGKEVFQSSSERIKRKRSAKKGAKKRRGKMARTLRKRKISMRKRGSLDK